MEKQELKKRRAFPLVLARIGDEWKSMGFQWTNRNSKKRRAFPFVLARIGD